MKEIYNVAIIFFLQLTLILLTTHAEDSEGVFPKSTTAEGGTKSCVEEIEYVISRNPEIQNASNVFYTSGLVDMKVTTGGALAMELTYPMDQVETFEQECTESVDGNLWLANRATLDCETGGAKALLIFQNVSICEPYLDNPCDYAGGQDALQRGIEAEASNFGLLCDSVSFPDGIQKRERADPIESSVVSQEAPSSGSTSDRIVSPPLIFVAFGTIVLNIMIVLFY